MDEKELTDYRGFLKKKRAKFQLVKTFDGCCSVVGVCTTERLGNPTFSFSLLPQSFGYFRQIFFTCIFFFFFDDFLSITC